MKLHSINPDYYGGCYVIESGDGFCCYGFDVLDRKARDVLLWIVEHYNGRALTLQEREKLAAGFPAPGTAEHFAACADALAKGAAHAAKTRTSCPAELVPALIGLEGKRVECDHYGERVRFYVGKSTGWLPGHLMIKTRRSKGGEMLSADGVRNVRVIA